MPRLAIVSFSLLASVLAACAQPPPPDPPPAGTPRLVVLLVVDQARAEYLTRFAPYFRFGLGRLLAESVDFTQTRHEHAITKTASGHATILSGTHPSRHGVVANNWYERGSRSWVEADEDHAFEPERAPTRLLVSTLGDWLTATYPPSKVFAISIKSRTAVVSGGRGANGALWYDDDGGRFVSSDYYPEPEPAWLEAFHGDRLPNRLFGTSWRLRHEIGPLVEELGLESVDRGLLHGQLPRPVGPAATIPDSDYYASFRAESPFADAYLGELAQTLITKEGLGADVYPDLLVVGFSSLDYIGHRYGPNSPEVLDTLVRLDQVIGELLGHLDETAGVESVLVALTSDHGVPEIPERAGGRRFWVQERACVQQAAGALDDEFGEADWLEADLVFDRGTLAERGVTEADAERVLARALAACPGVERVFTASELASSGDETDPMAVLFRNSFHPERSPNLVVQTEEGALMSSYNETNHGSPYDYDRHVPWLLRLPSAAAAKVDQPVATVDVAPTIAEILGVEAPVDLDGRSRLDLLRALPTAAAASGP